MSLVASLVSLVAAVRARVLDRGACGPLADRHAAAAARRELAGHLLDAALLLRIGVDVGQHHHGCCLLELVHVHLEQLHRGPAGSGQSARHARARRRGQNASWAAHHPHPAARGELVYLVFGVGRPVPHLENGLLKIFRLVCGSSAQAPSCWRERRRQLSCAAAAGGLAEWPRA